TEAQADEFARIGVPRALERIVTAHPGWIADTLTQSWPQHDPDGIVAALRAVAHTSGPDEQALGAIDLPTTVVALAGDPLHPAEVAALWARSIPGAKLTTVVATCLADLGAAALAASVSGSR
ncbi:MAG TPA: hypothetical protein VHC41_03390, partial [Mycobacteriales bacterium]|nr:hypothetical protein [Mycobacteriales bacterium]